ncbi:MAG: AAA family ATPase, partial [Gemmatimonadetes bacterium]|nr:AAA family ATPase [Gemmatimonadota bacterium]
MAPRTLQPYQWHSGLWNALCCDLFTFTCKRKPEDARSSSGGCTGARCTHLQLCSPKHSTRTQEVAVRIAIAGKGGSGKTTLAGTLARLLARRGQQVIALDGGTNPNLAQALGITAGTELVALPGDILVRREDPNADPPSELSMP